MIEHQIMDPQIQEHFKGCLVPQVSLISWAQYHDLSLSVVECSFCDAALHPKTPFATKTMRGLIFEQCGCAKAPKDQAPFLYGSSDPVQRKLDRELAQSLHNHMEQEAGE